MIVTEKEYLNMWKEFDGMTFTPSTELIEEIEKVDNIEKKIFKYKILKTADEVYQEYLNEKENPIIELTIEEKLEKLEKEKSELESCVLELASMLGEVYHK